MGCAFILIPEKADAAKIMDDLVTLIKLDMSEFGNQKLIQGENEMHIPEERHRDCNGRGGIAPHLTQPKVRKGDSNTSVQLGTLTS